MDTTYWHSIIHSFKGAQNCKGHMSPFWRKPTILKHFQPLSCHGNAHKWWSLQSWFLPVGWAGHHFCFGWYYRLWLGISLLFRVKAFHYFTSRPLLRVRCWYSRGMSEKAEWVEITEQILLKQWHVLWNKSWSLGKIFKSMGCELAFDDWWTAWISGCQIYKTKRSLDGVSA